MIAEDVGVEHRASRTSARSRGLLTWIAFGLLVATCWLVVIAAHLRHGSGVHAATFAVTLVAWLAMTSAMMAPTAVPMLATLRSILAGRSPVAWWAFLAGYLAVWSGFAIGAAVVQHRLGHLAAWDGQRRRVLVAALFLAAAGIYQFSSLKARCLQACTAPMQWFLRHWRDGGAGAWRMGARHGMTCVGCCWALMALAVVGGAAAFTVMVVTAILMIIEKLPGRGTRWARPIGFGLLAVSAVLAIVSLRTADGAGHGDHHVEPRPPGFDRTTPGLIGPHHEGETDHVALVLDR